MTPEERQLLAGLFDRTRAASSNYRDPEAESLIADQVRQQPYAPYLLAQTVIVQEQALQAANQRLQELEARVQELEQGQANRSQSGGFLGGLGSVFGSSQPASQPRTSVPSSGSSPWTRQGSDQAYAPAQAGPSSGPWQQGPGGGGGGWAQAQQPQAGGGSFLKGALGAAAGVAGGVLLANSISGLFRNSNPFGIGSGLEGAHSAGGGLGNTFDPLPAGRMGDAQPDSDYSTTPASYEEDTEQDDGGDWSGSDDSQDI